MDNKVDDAQGRKANITDSGSGGIGTLQRISMGHQWLEDKGVAGGGTGGGGGRSSKL